MTTVDQLLTSSHFPSVTVNSTASPPLYSLVLALLLAWPETSSGQTLDWIRQSGGPGTDPGRAVTVDVHGDIYVAGSYNVDPEDVLNSDFLLMKYDPSGELLWRKQYDFSKTDRNWSGLSTDAVGNVFFGGSVSSVTGGRDAVLVKVDSTGNQLWQRQLEAGGDETFRNLRTDENGNVFVTGTTNGGSVDGIGNSGYDALVGKYDPDGTPLWMRQLHGNQIAEAWGLDVDTQGNVFISGPGEEPYSKILSKLSPTGVSLWDRRFDQTNFGNALSVAVDSGGNAFVAGTTSGSLGGPNAGGFDAFVRQYDGSGNVVWTQQFGTAQDDSIWGIAVGEAGKIVVGGHTNGSLADAHAGLADAYVGVLNAAGETTWFNQLGTPSADWGQGVAFGMDGAIYLAGFTDGALSDQPAMNTDFFLARFQPNISGDSDGDGDVDLEDLNNVRNYFGETGGPGDTNGDGLIDLEDLNAVRNNFGAGGSNSVPEPTALLLALMTAAGIVFSRIRHVLEPRLTLAALVGQSRRGGGAFAAQLSSTDRGRT